MLLSKSRIKVSHFLVSGSNAARMRSFQSMSMFRYGAISQCSVHATGDWSDAVINDQHAQNVGGAHATIAETGNANPRLHSERTEC
jgi:hypothetical protein